MPRLVMARTCTGESAEEVNQAQKGREREGGIKKEYTM